MKERPILFNTEMVKAILDSRKTETRRIVKPQPNGGVRKSPFVQSGLEDGHGYEIRCPFGQPGDRLWVRETWRIGAWREDGRFAIDYAASPELTRTPWVTITDDLDNQKTERYWISVTDELEAKGVSCDEDGNYHWEPGKAPLNWKPSIHMPRWASRINLEITNIGVERLQDIDDTDAEREGCDGADFKPGYSTNEFRKLWESINGQGSWAANPWVWVVEFARIS
jgi:hypothetical protein